MTMEQIKRVYDYIELVKSTKDSDFSELADKFSDIFKLRHENRDVDELIYVKLRLNGIKNESFLLKKEKQSLSERLFELEKRIFESVDEG